MRHYDWIEHHGRTSPNQIALVEVPSGEQLTYAQLDQRVAQLAGHLRYTVGLCKGDRVAALSQNRTALFELIFACARIGVIYVPLNWRLTVPELRHILKDANPEVLAADSDFEPIAASLASELGMRYYLRIGDAPSYEELLAGARPAEAPEPVGHDDIQMIMYTSGTTGAPKGALLTYGMTFWNAVNVGIPAFITPETRFLSFMPMFHTAGLNLFANPVFHAGGTVLLMRGFDPGATLAALGDPSMGITHTFAVPAAYQFMAAHPSFMATDLTRLKIACVGGAATPQIVLDRWVARGVWMPNGYGMTETGPGVTLLRPRDAARKAGSVGQPFLHTEIRVIDAQGNDVGVDEPGEIWVQGPNVTPGYWRNDKATQEAFSNGWFKTGDIIRRDSDGFCYVLDRAKDMYVSGGENVYPAEVESVLTALEAVSEAAVISQPDPRWGESGVAIIVCKDSASLTEAEILAHCGTWLAKFKHPRRIVFVQELPRTASGKIHKPTLRKLYAAP